MQKNLLFPSVFPRSAAEKIAAECAAQFFADEAARRCAPAFAALPERERKILYVLRKSDPAAFCARAEALLAGRENP